MSQIPHFLQGGGKMGQLMRTTDWANTPLGPADLWPDSLKQAVSIALNSGFGMAIYWGPQFILLYNDAYSTIPGNKHPWAFGQPGAVAWAEIWDGLQNEFEGALEKGQTVRKPDALLLMHRYGYTEECYFDYNLSPIININGQIGGVFNAVVETTYKVINDRRNRILMQLLQQLDQAHTLNEALEQLTEVLDGCNKDIAFYLLYTTGDRAGRDVQDLHFIAGGGIGQIDASLLIWPYHDTMTKGQPVHIEDLDRYLPQQVPTVWGESCSEALIVPISKDEARISGYLVMGVSPRKRLDADYEQFLLTVGIHAGTMLNNGHNYELDSALQREQALNEELASANEELSATNDELNRSQQSLASLNNELEDRVRQRTKDLSESEARFKNLIQQAPVPMLVLRGDDMVFDTFNAPMLELISRDRSIRGKTLFEGMPELIGQPIVDRLYDTYRTGRDYRGYEQPVTITRNGEHLKGFYNVVYRALIENGQIAGVIQTAFDVTEQVLARRKAEESATNVRNLVMTAHYALMILTGPDMMIELANNQLATLWGKSIDEITGRRLLEVLPELEGQPFPTLLKEVYDTGIAYGQDEEAFYLDTPEGPVRKYVSFYYDPMLDTDGQVKGIIVAAEDITEKVNTRLLLEQSYLEQQSLNEELTATNEELASANDELVSINKELAQAQALLQTMVTDLAASEARVRYMLSDAPVAIGIVTGPDLVIEAANSRIMELWGKNEQVINKPLQQALPELKGQIFIDLLYEVFSTGNPHFGTDNKALLMRNGQLEECYFNFVYHPLKDSMGRVGSVMIVASEVTEQVLARTKIEHAEEQLRFSLDAARVGTWYLNTKTREFRMSERMKEIFGFEPYAAITYEDAIACVQEDHRAFVRDSINRAITTGEIYNVEHPILTHDDQKLRWVLATGKLNDDRRTGISYFSGVMTDITEQKQDEQRKNDFIGMVSHELKTPLTSLSAYVQMLQARSRTNNDTFTTGALDKVNTQVKKMTTMINGFLNVSRLESGKIHLTKQVFRLDELVSEMVEESVQMQSSHTVDLLPCPSVTVEADRDKIGSVISNLLSNAVKYSPRGKRIVVNCEVQGNEAIVSVSDEGMGIKPQDIDKLFERYYRVNSKHTQTISGFGIGLYLCAEILQRHDGRIWVQSELGVGSTFSFSLPLA
ncbi:PAS domain-containing protein [Mucilaginibacter daejeonensis]|uniref:PAS domain-containing protein n=1 Tax=Mucilaginibacter daejeonensis TaxID=398049 RepID=UPI001D176D5F|nr:PAS domain-containing protein [Mucilaginibacter daejeonensis]UEG54223.1 PAS domain-containing protein [Mucilaginibacter daejeonensis]